MVDTVGPTVNSLLSEQQPDENWPIWGCSVGTMQYSGVDCYLSASEEQDGTANFYSERSLILYNYNGCLQLPETQSLAQSPTFPSPH